MSELQPHGYVAKGGGTTGATFAEINEGVYGDIMRGNIPPPSVLVCSAPGRIPEQIEETKKLTDHAIAAQNALRIGDNIAFAENFDVITSRFLGIIEGFNLDERKYLELLEQYEGALKLHVAQAGIPELIQGKILSDLIPNSELVWPDEAVALDEFGRIDSEKTKRMARKRLAQVEPGKTAIVPAHNGIDSLGHMLELTRGSGDAVGGHMARAKEEPYVIFTDTDGIYSADPRQIRTRPIKRKYLTFAELHAATQGGAYVVHVEGIRPVEQMAGRMEIRHYRKSSTEGTIVTQKRNAPSGEAVRIITGEVGNKTLRIVRRGGAPEDDFEHRVTSALRELEIAAKRVTADGQGATIIIDDGAFDKQDRGKLRKLAGADSVEIDDGIGLISIVGYGFLKSADALQRVGKAFADSGVNPRTIDTTGRRSALVATVKPEEFSKAIQGLHSDLVGTVS